MLKALTKVIKYHQSRCNTNNTNAINNPTYENTQEMTILKIKQKMLTKVMGQFLNRKTLIKCKNLNFLLL